MDLERQVAELDAALRADDAAGFARLLDRYPAARYDGAGDDWWMSSAASDGRLWAVELLVARGADVNKPSNSTDSVPSPEGPIVQAAGSGNVDLVRFLLDRGAVVNHVIGGRARCFALTQAAWGGHLEVVRLLVERGAAVNAVWGEKTAVDFAEWGQDEVHDYLRSVGGKTAVELGGAAG